jgi:hypothetical protein
VCGGGRGQSLRIGHNSPPLSRLHPPPDKERKHGGGRGRGTRRERGNFLSKCDEVEKREKEQKTDQFSGEAAWAPERGGGWMDQENQRRPGVSPQRVCVRELGQTPKQHQGQGERGEGKSFRMSQGRGKTKEAKHKCRARAHPPRGGGGGCSQRKSHRQRARSAARQEAHPGRGCFCARARIIIAREDRERERR